MSALVHECCRYQVMGERLLFKTLGSFRQHGSMVHTNKHFKSRGQHWPDSMKQCNCSKLQLFAFDSLGVRRWVAASLQRRFGREGSRDELLLGKNKRFVSTFYSVRTNLPKPHYSELCYVRTKLVKKSVRFLNHLVDNIILRNHKASG